MTHPLALVLTHVRSKGRPGQYDAILLAEVDRLAAEVADLADDHDGLQARFMVGEMQNAALKAEIDRLRACAHALSDIYRKTDGTMRTCNRNATIICNERLCHVTGCARANDILKATKETGDV